MEKTDYSKIQNYKDLSLAITQLQDNIDRKRKRLWVPFALAAIRSLKAFLTR